MKTDLSAYQGTVFDQLEDATKNKTSNSVDAQIVNRLRVVVSSSSKSVTATFNPVATQRHQEARRLNGFIRTGFRRPKSSTA